MGKYEIDIPDKLLIDAGGLLNEITKAVDALGQPWDKYTLSVNGSAETVPILQADMTMNDLMVLCIEQSVQRYQRVLEAAKKNPPKEHGRDNQSK